MIYAPLPRLAKFKLFEAGLGVGGTGGGGGVPVNTVPGIISGTPIVGQTLTATHGTWNGSPTSYQYQWWSWFGGTKVPGATSSTLLLTPGLAGSSSYYACQVFATNANGQSQGTFCTPPAYIGPVTNPSPSVRGTPTTGTVNAGTTVPLPTLVAGDNLCVVTVTSSTTPSTPTGWTLRDSIAQGTVTTCVYTKVAAGGDTFVSGTNWTGVYNAYAIENCATGYDASNATGNTGTTNSPVTSGTCSPTGTDDVCISIFGANGLSVSLAAPSGGITATSQVTQGNFALVTGYETLSVSGTTTARTSAIANGSAWAGTQITFN